MQLFMTLPVVGSYAALTAGHCPGSTFPTKMLLCIAFAYTFPRYHGPEHDDSCKERIHPKPTETMEKRDLGGTPTSKHYHLFSARQLMSNVPQKAASWLDDSSASSID